MPFEFNNLTKMNKDITDIKSVLGDKNKISGIGDGTVSGAIANIKSTSTKGIKITESRYNDLEDKSGVYFITDAKDIASDFADKYNEYSNQFDNINELIGNADIHNIADGTITGAISLMTKTVERSSNIVYSNGIDETEDIVELPPDKNADLLGGQPPEHYASKDDISDINSKIDTISNKIKDIKKSKVFDTLDAMLAWMKLAANKQQLNVGDNVFIKDIDTPDYWISEVFSTPDTKTKLYYGVTEMEMEKIDLTPYDRKIGDTDISSINNGTITGILAFLNNKTNMLNSTVLAGKDKIAKAVTAKGVGTNSGDTFDTMASNISKIKTDPILQSKQISLNTTNISETVMADSGYDGLDEVTASIDPQIKYKTISTNCTTTVTPDNGKVLSSVVITTNVQTGYFTDDATVEAGDILYGKIGYGLDGVLTGTMPNIGTVSRALDCEESYTIPKGYHDGTGVVRANSLTYQTISTASQWDILYDKTAYVYGDKITGKMPNNGAISKSLTCGAAYTIPAGYHNGSGKVTADSLASQTNATADASNILSGKTAYVNGTKLTGSMANKGAVSQSLNCGGSYTIPAGYHNGSGKVTANSLSSQTSASASSSDILSGKTAYVNGTKLTGSMTNNGYSYKQPGEVTTWSNGQGWTELRCYIPENGYYNTSSYLYVSKEDVLSKLGASSELTSKTFTGTVTTNGNNDYKSKTWNYTDSGKIVGIKSWGSSNVDGNIAAITFTNTSVTAKFRSVDSETNKTANLSVTVLILK